MDKKTGIVLEGLRGQVTKQAMDGRVLVELESEEKEINLGSDFSKRRAVKAPLERGVWVDLSSHDYSWI